MYSKENQVDSRALKSLLKFDPFSSGRYEAESSGGLSDDEYKHAVQSGLLFSPNLITCDHGSAVKRLLLAKKQCRDRKFYTDLFIAGLASGRLDYRAGLPAYAIALNFPDHKFEPLNGGAYCRVCGLQKEGNSLARTDRNFDRFAAGGVIGSSPLDIAFYLECHHLLFPVRPDDKSLKVTKAILDILRETPPEETAKKQVVKSVRKIPDFKASVEQVQLVLETLGYCSVLGTPEHKGYLHEFVNLGYAPRSSPRTDWRYPVDLWRGEFGLDNDAVDYWFSSYPLLD
ncbi:hypothetical protein WMF28_06895 [Sorangium sp. So ce590]|uniref:hypothetical protein n=1 Tax=Sorangium sp. So ce590 TaxID=3133317 RepID=UPI003F63A19C